MIDTTVHEEDDNYQSNYIDVIVFKMNGEYFASSIEEIQEILEPMDIKKVTSIDPKFLGILNLRGQVLGVVDLRYEKSQHEHSEFKPLPSKAYMVIATKHGPLVLVVDCVHEVASIPKEKVQTDSNIKKMVDSNYIKGFYHSNSGLVTIVNVSEFMSSDKIMSICDLVKEAA